MKRSKAALFATNTFWQGIDIKGDDLRCVIITRLPFEVPDHPLQKAVFAKIESEGGNAFSEYSLPRAIFMLKQGFGRLIRSKTDYGAVLILDSRILTRSYGRRFISSLPPARRVGEISDVRDFFNSRNG